MKDPEIDILIERLETRADLSVPDMSGVLHALEFLVPGKIPASITAERLATTDGALLVADEAYPNWSVHIHGRANDRDGHWRCTLRETDMRDNDAALGAGRSPTLARAILAALLRLSMVVKAEPGGSA